MSFFGFLFLCKPGIEKMCSFMRSEPVKAVSVYSSGLAEKHAEDTEN